MTRPIIGVTTSRHGGWRSFLMHRLALARAGARALRLVPGGPLPPKLDGLVIGGGDDIGAELYGGQVLPDVRIDPERLDRLGNAFLAFEGEAKSWAEIAERAAFA